MTQENIPWIKQLIAELKGLSNADLAVILDRPDHEEASLALSVQLIDGTKVWMVALFGHERKGAHRDRPLRGVAARTSVGHLAALDQQLVA